MDFKLVQEYTKDLSILYVEDNDAIRASTTSVFENFFKNVDVETNGLSALEKYVNYYSSHGVDYDLVITDINMPVLNGIDMAKKILEQTPTQPIIFVTAHDESSYMLEAIRMGASSFLIKPLKIDDLASVLHKVSQAICDRQQVQQHYTQIEEFSAKLQERNSELEKSLRVLNTMVYKDHHTNIDKTDKKKSTPKESELYRAQEQIAFLVKDDLPELKELHLEIDSLLIAIIVNDVDENIIYENLPKMTILFSNYAAILQLYSFYNELSKAMLEFTKIIQTVDLPEEKESRLNIFLFLESFIHVLGKWQNDLHLLEYDKLNYLDASIISDMSTISIMWKQEEVSIESSELEFF